MNVSSSGSGVEPSWLCSLDFIFRFSPLANRLSKSSSSSSLSFPEADACFFIGFFVADRRADDGLRNSSPFRRSIRILNCRPICGRCMTRSNIDASKCFNNSSIISNESTTIGFPLVIPPSWMARSNNLTSSSAKTKTFAMGAFLASNFATLSASLRTASSIGCASMSIPITSDRRYNPLGAFNHWFDAAAGCRREISSSNFNAMTRT